MMTMRGTLAGIGMLLALPVAAQEMFFYPSQGQSPEQQQYDAQLAQQRDSYNRALGACMQGRGYSGS